MPCYLNFFHYKDVDLLLPIFYVISGTLCIASKYYIPIVNELLSYQVPNLVTFYTIFITNKYAFFICIVKLT